MVKTIVFDMGGVIIDLNLGPTLQKHFPEEYHSRILEKVFYGEEWRLMDGGFMRPEDAIPRILPLFPEEFHDDLRDMITDFYPYMPPIKETEKLISRLKSAGYKVYLLSNATPRFFDEYLNYPALAMMDGYFISALYKLLKPQREIFEAFCNKFSLNPEECFFIDDTRANIEGAKAYGMKGFVFDTKDFEGLEKALNDESVYF